MGTTDENGKVLFTIEEAKEFLKVSRATVYRLLTKGLLAKKKVAGTRAAHITLDSLEDYKQAQSFTLEELAAEILALKRKVALLEHQSNQAVVGPAKKAPNYDNLTAILKKHHPEAFEN